MPVREQARQGRPTGIRCLIGCGTRLSTTGNAEVVSMRYTDHPALLVVLTRP